MENKIAIIGGDLRIVKLANMLRKDGIIVYSYGIENAEELENVIKCNTLEEALKNVNYVIRSNTFYN